MTTLSSEIYDAFKEAGATEATSRKAAEAIASYDQRFASIDSDLRVLKWMAGTNFVALLAVLARVYFP